MVVITHTHTHTNTHCRRRDNLDLTQNGKAKKYCETKNIWKKKILRNFSHSIALKRRVASPVAVVGVYRFSIVFRAHAVEKITRWHILCSYLNVLSTSHRKTALCSVLAISQTSLLHPHPYHLHSDRVTHILVYILHSNTRWYASCVSFVMQYIHTHTREIVPPAPFIRQSCMCVVVVVVVRPHQPSSSFALP